jgi:dUTP pyrophosphatase
MALNIKIKKLHKDAVIPTKAHATDAGCDLYATSCHYDNGLIIYGTGIAVEIPEGYVGLVFPRSSIANTHLTLSNSVGVIDSGYRGEVMAKFRKGGSRGYNVGERIAQLIILPYPEVVCEEADELSESDRGTGGYGSSGK